MRNTLIASPKDYNKLLIKIIITCGIYKKLLRFMEGNPLEFTQSFFTTLYSVRHLSPSILLTLVIMDTKLNKICENLIPTN